MPYSVSVPMTRKTLITTQPSAGGRPPTTPATGSDTAGPVPSRSDRARSGGYGGAPPRMATSQVLAGVGARGAVPAGLGALLEGDEGLDVVHAIALLAGDTRPAVG